ncbi:ribosomal RNA processing protein 1-like [Quillaja saponaria]|uniref:Ribosomal RNA processing protein 1-like n=1 Tax=Quillaja saponaria TaxID=32244 RepID=A0AAD7LDS6_QUISA|nr:ribosomal RNA processing protein 1-like [Quillaja saponaria]
MGDETQLGLSLIKQLASCNQTIRNKALKALLKDWLPSQSQLTDDNMKKLWKGLFYCVWHADKFPVQSRLIDSLSSLLVAVDLRLAVQYFSCFLLTMRREWTGIDGLRLDKFYLLIRRFMHNFCLLLKNNSWDLELTERLMGVLEKGSFLAEDKFQGNGVNYHIASVFLEELGHFLPIRSEALDVLFKTFIFVMGKLPDKVLLGKIKANMFDVLLRMGKQLLEIKKSGDGVELGDDVVVYGTIALVKGFSSKFYNMGSSPECCQGNRKQLFALHEVFMKLEKDLTSTGFVFSIPDVDDHCEEEVQILMPIASKMEVDATEGDSSQAQVVANGLNVPAGKPLKKCKKDKKASGASAKKEKKNKNGNSVLASEKSPTEDENEKIISSNDAQSNVEYMITNNESVISNLGMQFEKIAAEVGLDDDVASACHIPKATLNRIALKKRKRSKSLNGQQSENREMSIGDDEVIATAKSGERSAKKVRFSMKSNLVWKPHSPLPPQSLRLPASVTPRGSALKKGVAPGPIREMPPLNKKVKLKKARKAIKVIPTGVKRPRKLKSRST